MNESAPSDDAYRPLSGFALSGFIVSSLFALLVLLSAGVGIMKGAPIFLPLGVLLLAAVGFALCYAGQRQIQGAEGTRVGLFFARYGMAIALFSGLGYAAYYLAIGFAVGQQADTFLAGEPGADTGFLTRLQRGGKDPAEINTAFLYTLPAASRGRVRPDDEDAFRQQNDAAGPNGEPGHLSRFRAHPLVRMLSRAGSESRIESLGVREWEHEKNSYKVARNYRIETPEGSLLVTLRAESTEGEAEGQHRKWFVNFQQSGIQSREPTPLGRAVEQLSDQSRTVLERAWLPAVRAGKMPTVEKDASNWNRLVADAPDFMRGGKNVVRERFRSLFHQALSRADKDTPANLNFPRDSRMGLNSWPAWDRDPEGRVWFAQPFAVTLFDVVDRARLQGDGVIKMRTVEPLPPERMTAPVPFLNWEVVSVVLERLKAKSN